MDPDNSSASRALASRDADINAAPTRNGKNVVTKDVIAELLSLPFVMAGPMVRRAEPSQVWLWLCTCTPVSVTARIFIDGTGSALGSGAATSCSFGDRLHVTMVSVAPTGAAAFPTDTLLSYDMDIASTRDETHAGDAALLPADISYNGRYPAFVLPGPRTKTILVQGSCRKIPGAGKDAMAAADAYLAAHNTWAERPQQIILTGDQIYADDVADECLHLGQLLGPALVGFDELVSLPDTGALAGHTEGVGREWRAASTWSGGKGKFDRGNVLRGNGQTVPRFTFDAGAGDNHLVAFCEYATTYLLMWSGVFWGWAKSNYPFRTYNKAAWPPDSKYNMASAAAQRVLANTPSYMMCDDHEVTDDWRIDAPFARSIGYPPFDRIVANALAAYWVFQGWGNRPDRFGFHQSAVSEYINGPEASDFPSKIIQHHWDFITPSPPSVAMLDTRTRRALYEPPKPAGLLDMGALADLEDMLKIKEPPETSRVPDVVTPVIIASPPPVFGHVGFEAAQKSLIDSVHFFTRSFEAQYEYDFESWAANREWFIRMLDRVQTSKRKRVVMFGGDVHYSCTAVVKYQLDWNKPLPPVEVLHLTSSAIKNRLQPGWKREVSWLISPR